MRAYSNQAIQAQPAERSFNQQLKGTTRSFQDLVEEVNTKTGIGYKVIEDSDQPNKLKVLYQQTVQFLEEEILKHLQRQNKLVPYQGNFVEEHLKKSRKCKAGLDYHWRAYISKGTQPAMNAEQKYTTQAVNDIKSNKNYPTDNPIAQNSAKRSNSKWPRDGECFGNIFGKARVRGKDDEIRC